MHCGLQLRKSCLGWLQKTFLVLDKEELRERLSAAVGQVRVAMPTEGQGKGQWGSRQQGSRQGVPA